MKVVRSVNTTLIAKKTLREPCVRLTFGIFGDDFVDGFSIQSLHSGLIQIDAPHSYG